MKSITLIFFSFCIISLSAQEIIKPNVIIFYADDLGWQDTELNNEGILTPWETPNMLKLAAMGANFKQAYSPAPTCAPSRAAMMSGLHPVKTKMTHVAGGQIPVDENYSNGRKLITPYYPGRLQLDEISIAEILSPLGYVSGHIGKWHMAAHHNTFPEATDQGFNYQFTGRGVANKMDDRSTDFATDDENDPYKIDEDGRPYDEVTEKALQFMEDNKEEPFFMYMATWLVHTPIQTRDLALLTYYSNKLGIPLPTNPESIRTEGQTNPYYGAMVATLDWSLGKIVDYLENTDDPRNPGKKLSETTYIIFSSDNGGYEKKGTEIITDNFPLDQGKIYAQEGGIRVPLVIAGPNIQVKNYNNVVSQLDFFPTIMAMTGANLEENKRNNLDGVNLFPLLKGESNIIEDRNGNERKDLYWHFPHGTDTRMQSAIRSGMYKLYKNYIDNTYEAYQLYDTEGNNFDLSETNNIIASMPSNVKNTLINKLETFLTENNATSPLKNPSYNGFGAPLENQNRVPIISLEKYDENTKIASIKVSQSNDFAKINKSFLLYKNDNPGEREEWFEINASMNNNTISAQVPEGATSAIFVVYDENDFIIQSKQISTVPKTYLILNDTDIEESFSASEDYNELLGNATINSNYVQSRTIGGGDGVKYAVKTSGDFNIENEKITFRIRSLDSDNVRLKISIDNQEKIFEYTSTSDKNDAYFDFEIPITFSKESKDLEVYIEDLINTNNNTTPRFRLYGLTFHKKKINPNRYIELNSNDLVESFSPSETFNRLIGNATAVNNYIQSRTLNGGDGASFLVKTIDSNISCNKISFWIRSQNKDIVEIKVTIGNQEKIFNYTSVNDTDNVYLDFDLPTNFTSESQEIEVLVTSLSNSDGLTPRFRVYGIGFHKSQEVLDVNQDEFNSVLKLFPNPANNTFSFSEEVKSIKFYNILGQEKLELKNKFKNINISNLPSGIYILKVVSAKNKKTTMNFIKK